MSIEGTMNSLETTDSSGDGTGRAAWPGGSGFQRENQPKTWKILDGSGKVRVAASSTTSPPDASPTPGGSSPGELEEKEATVNYNKIEKNRELRLLAKQSRHELSLKTYSGSSRIKGKWTLLCNELNSNAPSRTLRNLTATAKLLRERTTGFEVARQGTLTGNLDVVDLALHDATSNPA
uniref:Uncharacterized protein n=1 Tax=Sphaerodactylus townsendi TaxID=933632 RepID=A0ACB8EML8_9SAUR